MSRTRADIFIAAAAIGLGLGSASIAAPDVDEIVRVHAAGHGQGGETFLGFRIGQEIRYALERDGDVPADARVTWGIRLDGIEDELGVFGLTYEAIDGRGDPAAPPGQAGEITALATGTAWINAHGFPTRVRFVSQRLTPSGPLGYSIEYRFEDRRMFKRLEGREKEQDKELDDYETIDLRAPAGMYLFHPVHPECLAAADIEAPCLGREPLFANPGLLSLTMPAVWDSGTGSLSFVALSPTGVIPRILMGGNPAGGSGFTVGGYNLLGGSGPDPFSDAEDALQTFAIRADGDLLQLDVGGRTVDAWRLDVTAPLESAYVDGSGSIVRIDLATTGEATGDYRIRRLRPSEY